MKRVKVPNFLPHKWIFGQKWYKVPAEQLKVYGGVKDLKKSNILEGNLISSAVDGNWHGYSPLHYPILDLDIPSYYFPSSTNGHAHLYLDIALSEEKMTKLVDVLVECGILNQGIKTMQWERNKELTLRPPWVRKGEEKSLVEQQYPEVDSESAT